MVVVLLVDLAGSRWLPLLVVTLLVVEVAESRMPNQSLSVASVAANIQWKIFQVVFSGSGHLTRMELVAMVAVLLMVVPGSGGDPAMPHQNANASPGW